MANGTFRIFANVCANRVLPLPGFGYNMAKAAMEGAQEGLLEALSGPLEAAAAGIGVAVAFGYIIAMIFTPKSPKR